MIIGWDTSTTLVGWCAGYGDELPVADAFSLPYAGSDFGKMLVDFDHRVRIIHQRFPAEVWVFEAPILVPGRDKTEKIRKLYSVAGHLEFMGKQLGVHVEEGEVKKLKRTLAGFAKAQKADMVYVAEKVGVKLPPTKEEGRQDAADGFAAWLTGMQAHCTRDVVQEWDKRLYRARGALL